MQATVVEYAHRAYTAAFQDIFGVLAVLSILTAVVCIVTLRQPMLDPAPEAACAESARGNGAVWRPGGGAHYRRRRPHAAAILEYARLLLLHGLPRPRLVDRRR